MPFHFTLKAQAYTRFKPTISEVACNSIISWYVKLCEFLRRRSIRVLSKSLKLWFTLLRYNQNDCILWSWILDLCSLCFKLLISEFTRVSPNWSIKIFLIVLSKHYFTTFFGSFLLWHWSGYRSWWANTNKLPKNSSIMNI